MFCKCYQVAFDQKHAVPNGRWSTLGERRKKIPTRTFPQRKGKLPSRGILKMIFTWCWHSFSGKMSVFFNIKSESEGFLFESELPAIQGNILLAIGQTTRIFNASKLTNQHLPERWGFHGVLRDVDIPRDQVDAGKLEKDHLQQRVVGFLSESLDKAKRWRGEQPRNHVIFVRINLFLWKKFCGNNFQSVQEETFLWARLLEPFELDAVLFVLRKWSRFREW